MSFGGFPHRETGSWGGGGDDRTTVEHPHRFAEAVEGSGGGEVFSATHPMLHEEGSPDADDGDKNQGRGLHRSTVRRDAPSRSDLGRCVADEAGVTAGIGPIE